MKSLLLLAISICISVSIIAQPEKAKTSYKNVSFKDLCGELNSHPGHLLLDVRSKEEFEDKADMASMNIGKLHGAKNINYENLEDHLTQLQAYKNKPIFIYCSHARRSALASALLIDKGFTNIINIEGGLSTINKFLTDSCLNKLYERR